MKSLTSLLLLPALGSSYAGDGTKSGLLTSSSATSGWKLESISAGAAWRSLGKLDYRNRSNSNQSFIPPAIGGDSLDLPPIGPTGGLGNRQYDNGFVNIDGTGSLDGNTWFWGYESSGQVSGNELQFSAAGSRSDYRESSSFSGNFDRERTLEDLTPQIDFHFVAPPSYNTPFDGLLLSFWAFSEDTGNSFSNFSATQNREDFRLDFTDTYDISAITPIIGAPYAGTSGGPGPTISNIPFSREETELLTGSQSAVFTNSISTSLDLNGYSLALGPTWNGEISSDWSWQASAGVTLNIFNWKARETEKLNLSIDGAPSAGFRNWRSSDSGTDLRFGLYAKGEIVRRINDQWFASAYLQGEIADSVEIEVGDSKYEFQPKGYALGLSFGRRF